MVLSKSLERESTCVRERKRERVKKRKMQHGKQWKGSQSERERKRYDKGWEIHWIQSEKTKRKTESKAFRALLRKITWFLFVSPSSRSFGFLQKYTGWLFTGLSWRPKLPTGHAYEQLFLHMLWAMHDKLCPELEIKEAGRGSKSRTSFGKWAYVTESVPWKRFEPSCTKHNTDRK